MGLFSKQKQETGKLHYVLKLAFERVKNDMHNLFAWINYFQEKHNQHDQRLTNLEQKFNQIPNTRNEIKQIVDYHSPHSKITELSRRIDEIHKKIEKLEEHKKEKASKPNLKERLLRKISRNSKEYTKSVILGTIKKYKRISGPQLKEMIVKEQGLCSKSSFYRLLKEIEKENEISSIQDGKEKTYFHKTQVKN